MIMNHKGTSLVKVEEDSRREQMMNLKSLGWLNVSGHTNHELAPLSMWYKHLPTGICPFVTIMRLLLTECCFIFQQTQSKSQSTF